MTADLRVTFTEISRLLGRARRACDAVADGVQVTSSFRAACEALADDIAGMIGHSITDQPPSEAFEDMRLALDEGIPFLQGRRRDALRAIRACPDSTADYWRWQGHAELSRQLLQRLGAEVPS